MPRFQVWSEGYRTTGESAGAQFHGEWEGETFPDACERFMKETGQMRWYNRERNTFWGCRFFPSGNEAAKSFG